MDKKNAVMSLNRKYTVPALLILSALWSAHAWASPQEELQQNIEDRTEIQQEIMDTQSKINAIEQETRPLQQRCDELQAEIDDHEEALADLDLQLSEAEEELDYAEMELSDMLQIYYAQVRHTEEYGTSSFWSILLKSDSIADLLNRVDYVESLMSYQVRSIEELEAQIAALQDKEVEIETLRADRHFAAKNLKLLRTQLYNELTARLDDIRLLQEKNDESKAEFEALLARSRELFSQMNGTTSEPSLDPDYIYEKYVVATGQQALCPIGAKIARYVLQYLGDDYVWGGASPETGFDCSGMLYYSFRQFGYNICRTTRTQYKYSGVEIGFDELRVGDMVFFHPTGKSHISHVGLYLGDGMFVHAANPRKGVIVSSLYSKYYSSNYYGAKRVLE